MSTPQSTPLVVDHPARAKNAQILAYGALFAGVLFLSLSGLYVRWANAPGVVTSFFRMTIAAALMSPFLAGPLRRLSASATGRISWGLLGVAALGGVFTALDHGAWSTSLAFTRVANATLLNNTAPVWVALAAYFIFKVKLKKYFWFGLGLAMVGASVVLASDVIGHPVLGWGDLIALGSGLFYAGYFLVTQRARRGMSAFAYMAVVDLVAALCLFVFCLLFKQPLVGYPLQSYLVFIAAALFSQVAGHLALSYALGHLPAFVVAPTMIAQPVLTALLAIPLLGETLQAAQWIGGLAVLAGIYLVNRSQEN